MHQKKQPPRRSFVLRLAVCFGGLTLLAWQGKAFPRLRVGEILPGGQIQPHLPVIPQRWRMAAPVPIEAVIAPARTVKVRLFADQPISEFSIESAGGLQVGKRRLKGVLHVSRGAHGVVVTDDGEFVLHTMVVDIRPFTNSELILRTPRKGNRHTVGSIEVSALPRSLTIVNQVDLEAYVLGTVEPELGGFDLPLEALKAQIIASRSYVLALHDRHRGTDYDFCDTAHCLMFTGVRKYPVRFRRAAAECRGVYLSYKGHPAAAFFHHGCGGETAAIEEVWPVSPVAYLKRISDGNPSYCRFASRAEWNFSVDRTSLRRCFVARGWVHGNDALDSLGIILKSPGGRAQQILIQSARPRWVSANLFRRVINNYYQREVLYSTLFTTRQEGEWIRFSGRGWGHGVGMCQSGAIHLARHGASCRAILAHYFPGTSLARLLDSTAESLESDAGARRDLSRLSY